MGSIADELVAIPFLRHVPTNELRASAPFWERVALGPGEALWEAGTPVDALGVVLLGELVAELDGVTVGRVLPGELAGEASAFFAGSRSATLRAGSPARVLTLPIASLHTLRWQGSAVYEALLDQALRTLVRRVGATNARIAEVATGGLAGIPARTEPSAFVRLWKALRSGGPRGGCPPLEPLLRRQPGLVDAHPETLGALGQGFVAEPVQEGQVVFLEGEAGSAAWLVADGRIDVIRNVRGDRAELLASLGPGSLFGVNSLVEEGPRTASCVAASAGWLYRMDADGYARLRGPYRLAWRECVLGVLATQIRNANAALQKASGELSRASGWLEGVPHDALAGVEVVVTDDQTRNRRRYA